MPLAKPPSMFPGRARELGSTAIAHSPRLLLAGDRDAHLKPASRLNAEF